MSEDNSPALNRERALNLLGLSAPSDLTGYERAYRTRLSVYRQDSLASYTLLEGDERRERLASLDQAYELLRREATARLPRPELQPDASPALSPSHQVTVVQVPTEVEAPKMEASDVGGAPSPAPFGPGEAAEPSEDRAPAPESTTVKALELDLDAPGQALYLARQQLGLSREELATTTRISKTHLQALEEEDFSSLPPAAYIRGFAIQYARALGFLHADAESLADALLHRR